MKLTDSDFTSHVCNDADKDGDGLGWNLDTDLTTEGKNEIIQALKLQTIVKKKILAIPKQIKNAPSSSWKADYELLQIEFKELIKDSEKIDT